MIVLHPRLQFHTKKSSKATLSHFYDLFARTPRRVRQILMPSRDPPIRPVIIVVRCDGITLGQRGRKERPMVILDDDACIYVGLKGYYRFILRVAWQPLPTVITGPP